MSIAELQPSDHGHWEDDDGEVRCDVDGGVGEPHGELVDAARRLVGPESVHWYAVEDAAEDCPEGIANYHRK